MWGGAQEPGVELVCEGHFHKKSPRKNLPALGKEPGEVSLLRGSHLQGSPGAFRGRSAISRRCLCPGKLKGRSLPCSPAGRGHRQLSQAPMFMEWRVWLSQWQTLQRCAGDSCALLLTAPPPAGVFAPAVGQAFASFGAKPHFLKQTSASLPLPPKNHSSPFVHIRLIQ